MSQMSLNEIGDLIGKAGLAAITGAYVVTLARDAYKNKYELWEGAKELGGQVYDLISEWIFPKTPNQEIFEDELRYK